MNYQYFRNITIDNFLDQTVEGYYDRGFVFTRLGKGVMHQVRSLRVNLKNFELTSENRRVLKKSENISCLLESLPKKDYHWSIGKMALDFYTTKFGEGIMSANKVKEMFCDPEKSNMNSVFVYRSIKTKEVLGYCLAYQSKDIIHYAYPFYTLYPILSTLSGISMMTKAVVFAQETSRKYLYLGSVQERKAVYKLQFEGLEWWDGVWNSDLKRLKSLITH